MHWFIENLQAKGSCTAIVYKEHSYTYKNLYERIHVLYNEIIKKIECGAVVGLVSDYSFDAIAVFFSLMENKNIIVPITVSVLGEQEKRIDQAECSYVIKFVEGVCVINQRNVLSAPHELIQKLQKESVPGLILFSSGSTGVPKAMVHDLSNLIESYKGKRIRNMVFLIFLMFDHIGGLNTLLNALAMHVTMVFPENRDPDYIAKVIERYKVNVFPASPTFLNLLLISGVYKQVDFSSLRMVTYGTEAMPSELLLRLKELFPRVKFLQTFGTSETGISSTRSMSSSSTFMKFDDPNVEYKIVSGELWLRSKVQILGYINAGMDKFTQDGWFKTGDLVEEKNGYIKIIGRNSEIINVGGEKVLPSEVEAVLFQMPDVEDVTVYGEKNPITGQIVACKLVYRDKAIKSSELKKIVCTYCEKRLAKYKIPVRVTIVDSIEYTDRFKKKR